MAHTHDYDFIIVGAGSAGCVLADRLTQCGRFSVLLIEAGGTDQKFWIKVPLGYGFTFSNPKVNWCYTTAADPGLAGREVFWPRGRVLGGSSSINAMAYVRGLPHDFDDWVSAGATGWDWNTVRRSYDALETNDEFTGRGDPAPRGSGLVHVSDLRPEMHPFSGNFLSAAAEIELPVLDDMNAVLPDGSEAVQGEGLGFVRSTVRGGRRWSSADAFLRPAKARGNLTVVCGGLVEQLKLDGTRVVGVSYRKAGQLRQIAAHREVIVSAGAINSPQLLQLSGIGPAQVLKNKGISVVADLSEVGQGLQDHLAVSHNFWATQPTLNAQLGSLLGQAMAGFKYIMTRRGPLSVPVNQVSGFARTKGALLPDVQLYCNPATYTMLPSGKPKVDRNNGYVLSVQPSRPTSRGSVMICSADPAASPVIQPNSLATTADQRVAIEATRLLQKLASTPALTQITRTRREPDLLTLSDGQILDNFRTRASTVFHASCTCRMGNDAKDSVLDSRLRVHGVTGLRVVDASAFPNVTSGNTNAPTLMLAARGAEMILEDNQSYLAG